MNNDIKLFMCHRTNGFLHKALRVALARGPRV